MKSQNGYNIIEIIGQNGHIHFIDLNKVEQIELDYNKPHPGICIQYKSGHRETIEFSCKTQVSRFNNWIHHQLEMYVNNVFSIT